MRRWRSRSANLRTARATASSDTVLAPSLSSVAIVSWAKAYLVHLRQRGVPYAKAVRALSNKWAKILAAVLATRAVYDEGTHVADLLRNSVPWVSDLANEAA